MLTVFLFYFFRGKKWWCLLGQLLGLYWVNVELLGGLVYPIRLLGMELELCQQGLALLALIPIWLYHGRQGYHSKPFQYVCYGFYPVHMLVIVADPECYDPVSTKPGGANPKPGAPHSAPGFGFYIEFDSKLVFF